MLVMVLEAANQIADKTRQVIGFRIGDAHFFNVLKITPTSQGIETQLRIRILRNNSDMNSVSSEFRLYACDNGQWIEVSCGTIQVQYKQDSTEVDGGKEARAQLKWHQQHFENTMLSCSEPTGTEEFYEKLWKLGYTFGEDFRALGNVQHNKDREAIADVHCYAWRSNGKTNPPQTHIVHPITLDAMIQAGMAGFSRGANDAVPTGIPSIIKTLWISNSGLSAPQTQSVKVRTRTTSTDNFGFDCSIVALSQSIDRLLVEVEGLRCRFVTSVGSTDVHQSKQISYNIAWMPDIDLLNSEQIAAFCQSAQPSGTEYTGSQQGLTGPKARTDNAKRYGPFGKYLSALTFKNPRMKILQFNSRVGENTILFLEAIKSSQAHKKSSSSRYDKWVLTDPSELMLEQAREAFVGYNGTSFQQLDVEKDPLSQGFEAGSYDIILVDTVFDTMEKSKTTFQYLRKLLKPFGKLVLFNTNDLTLASPEGSEAKLCQNASRPSNPELMRSDLHGLLSKNGFSGIDVELADGTVITTPVVPRPALAELLRCLLVIDTASEYQKALAGLVQLCLQSKADISTEIVSLNDLASKPTFRQTVCIFFLELEKAILKDLQSSSFAILREVLATAKGVVWLSAGGGHFGTSPDFSIIDGLARVLRLENENLKFIMAKLETQIRSPELQALSIFKIIDSTDFESHDQNYESAFLEVNGQLRISRIVDSGDLTEHIHSRALPQQSYFRSFGGGPPLKLAVGVPGLLDTLHFVEDPTPLEPLATDDIEIKVHAAGVNFKDLLLALGRVSGTTFGNECAGTVHRAGANSGFKPGDRVCLSTTAAFNTYTRAKAAGVARVPDDISFVEASAIPTQFGTAYFAIHNIAHMQNGESILIHSGAGGTGQAAIQLAKCLNAEIFVTVGSNKKKQFLIDEYGIPEDHIFFSRDTSFAKGVKRLTQNQGVDVVLNTLSGEGLLASWDCIASYGRFVELGKREIQANASLPMAPFLRNASFASFEGSLLAAQRPWLAKSSIEAVLALFAQKKARLAKPLHVLSISDTVKALRMLQSGNTIGKIVLEITSNAMVPTTLDTKPAVHFNANSTYLVAGGFGGLGKSIARWMVQRGAKHILLLSRLGAHSAERVTFLQELAALGASVKAPACDITDEMRLRSVLEQCSKTMPPIKGCVQGTAVLKDALFQNMSYGTWEIAIRSKVHGSWNLHSLLPNGLDFFVLLSSISGVLGTAGQSNYAAGNMYMDALAHYRIAHGQKAAVLDLGVMVSDGMLVDNPGLKQKALASGHSEEITRPEFYALLEYYCDPEREILTQEECQTVYGLSLPATMRARGKEPGHRMALPFFRHMFQIGTSAEETEGATEETVSHRQKFAAAATPAEAGEVVCQALIDRLAHNLPSLADNPDLEKPLHSYGVDSLMAIELRNWLANEFGADVPIFEISGESSLTGLGVFVARSSAFGQAAWVE